MPRRLAARSLGLAIALTAVSCGGGSDTPSSPSPTGSAATITITATGVSPRSVTIPIGGRVLFVNNDSRAHDMSSNPHPDHRDCPAINDAGFLQPGQSRQTGNLTIARTCGFHDHGRDSDTSLQGTIVIQ